MGILNITPDSFSDQGQFQETEKALSRIQEMINQGASIIDIGAESSRPGAEPLSPEAEQKRLQPILEQLTQFPKTTFSLDSYHLSTMKWALKYNIDIINDITGTQIEHKKIAFLKAIQIPYIAMHMQNSPQTMQKKPSYHNIMQEICQAFNHVIRALGDSYPIILDPGIGFGKTQAHNILILQKLKMFKQYNKNILIGVSNKSIIGHLTSKDVSQRLAGSISAAIYAHKQGADILRVHHVDETVDAIKVWKGLSGGIL